MVSKPVSVAGLALFGAVVGAGSLAVGVRFHPDVTFEMDRALPSFVSGIYPPERDRELTFAWTGPRARILFTGLDRRIDWTCTARFRGGRSAPNPQPTLSAGVDGATAATRLATNDYQDFDIAVPRRPERDGLTLTFESSLTQVGGKTDPRQLGVQLDRVSCRPASGVLPPLGALTAIAVAGSAFALAFVLLGFPGWQSAIATLLLVSAAAAPLAHPASLYGRSVGQIAWLGLSIAGSLAGLALILGRWRRTAVERSTAFVLAFSASVLFLKLIALLHPDKPLQDAVFHAHRLEAVLGGHFYFTQPLPDGVQFPYAIALYVVAAPWTWLITDHVALLKIVVSCAEVIAGLLVYWMMARVWTDRPGGALAVVFFHAVPVAYWIVGNANLTNAFGQSASVAALAGAVLLPAALNRPVPLTALALLISTAFLSHVSTFGLLGVTLIAASAFEHVVGDADLRRAARAIAAATCVAAVLSVVLYYGHFMDVYRGLGKIVATNTATTNTAAAITPQPSSTGPAATPSKQEARPPLSVGARLVKAVSIAVSDLGWPLLLLAAVGVWRIGHEELFRDRLGGILAGCAAAYVVFAAVGTMAPVGARFERYAAEFIGRLDHATSPAVAILAGRGAVWGWQAGHVPRIVAAALVMTAVALAAQQWVGWLS